MAGAAVHVASMIGATPYYVAKGEDSEIKTFTLPSMSIMSLISKFDRSPMLEILEAHWKDRRPFQGGDMSQSWLPRHATVWDRITRFVRRQRESCAVYTDQNPASEKSVMSEIKKKGQFIGKDKEGWRNSSPIISSPELQNRVYRSFMEQKRLVRAEIWEGPDGHRVRDILLQGGETMEGDPGTRKSGLSIQGEMMDKNQLSRTLLTAGDYPPLPRARRVLPWLEHYL